MASKKESGESKQASKKEKAEKTDRKTILAVIIFAIIIVFAVAGAVTYGLNNNGSTSFATFSNNFNNAQHVAILVTAYNGTALSSTVGCATNLIEQIVATHSSAHKNATAIDFYVINQTSCIYSPGGLGQAQNNFSHSTPGQCVNMSASEPRIFINYSTTNNSRITPQALYVSGNIKFLVECGVASELIGSGT
ncbi:MAG: hypothetical protein ACHQX1_03515 [Candidatus Micrarchaeales archaeon]